MLKEYKTVSSQAVAELEEKKSRFIATVKPVATEEEAFEFINALKTKYWDATHNVYAFSIGTESLLQRFSDDGEPSGTAGLPVMEAIKRSDLRDVAVVVTRYFGGTLLGAAGLIRTYGRSALMGLEAAGVVTRRLCREMQLVMEYTLLGKLQNVVLAAGYSIKEITYGADVEMAVRVPVDETDEFEKLVIEASSGRVLIEQGEQGYIDINDGRTHS